MRLMGAPNARLRDDDEAAGLTMGFLEHLDELRTRLIRSCIAIAAGMGAAFFFVERIGDFVLAPTLRTLPAGSTLVSARPGEGFSFYLDISLIGGVVLAAPAVMYQVWRFIAPGLYAREKRLAVPFVALTTVGTIGGALFSHYVLFPSTMAFFGTFNPRGIRFMPRVEETFDLYKQLLFGMVIVFQVPTVVFFLAKMRIVTARLLWRNAKYAVLVSFILSAVLTSSPDPWNQAVFAAPMIALYFISIAIAWIVNPRQEVQVRERDGSPPLRLIVTAAVMEQVRKHRVRTYRRHGTVLAPDRW
jgi:sec-independent protein translocase protein TatC